MGSLVTHVCCGVGGEVDTSLELLCDLVKENSTEMAQYAVFVKVQLNKVIYVFARGVESLQFGLPTFDAGNFGLYGQPDTSADPQTLPPPQQTGLRSTAAGVSHPGSSSRFLDSSLFILFTSSLTSLLPPG